jgi:hypothetical protein
VRADPPNSNTRAALLLLREISLVLRSPSKHRLYRLERLPVLQPFERPIDRKRQRAAMSQVLPRAQHDLLLRHRREPPRIIYELHVQVDRHLPGLAVPRTIDIVAGCIRLQRQGTTDCRVRLRHDAVRVLLYVVEVPAFGRFDRISLPISAATSREDWNMN